MLSSWRGTCWPCRLVRNSVLADDAVAEPLGPAEAGQCRAPAASANYLSLGWPDLGLAAKERCRRVSAPAQEERAARLPVA
eukprot:548699-Alexandrium_andersonii.AAC.1